MLDALNELLGPHIFPPRADGGDPRHCPSCGTGRLSLKLGKFGAFIGCSNYPECRFTRQLAVTGENGNGAELGGDGTRSSATIRRPASTSRSAPAASAPMSSSARPMATARSRSASSLPKGWDAERPSTSTPRWRCSACRARSASHPETGKPIIAGIGRYGPFVQHDGTYANLDSVDEVFTVGVNRAVSLLAEKQAGGGRRRRPRDADGAEGRSASIRPKAARSRSAPAATAPT